MKTDRLLQLADYLENVVAKLPDVQSRFSMGHWFERLAEACGFDRPTPVVCGTSACALGWATAVWPELKIRIYEKETQGIVAFQPDGEDGCRYEGIAAAEVFFGLDNQQAHHLFAPGGGNVDIKERTVEQEVAVIRNMVQEYQQGILDLAGCECCDEQGGWEEEEQEEEPEEEPEEFENDENEPEPAA